MSRMQIHMLTSASSARRLNPKYIKYMRKCKQIHTHIKQQLIHYPIYWIFK